MRVRMTNSSHYCRYSNNNARLAGDGDKDKAAMTTTTPTTMEKQAHTAGMMEIMVPATIMPACSLSFLQIGGLAS